MLHLIIILTILLIILIVLFIIALKLHNAIFNNRYVKNPLIKLYTQEEFNLECQEYNFKCAKETLHGYLYFKDNYKKNKIIIFTHGMFSDHKSYMQDIAYFVNNSYSVFAYDLIGVSTSSGKNQLGMGNALKSLNAAIIYVKMNFKDNDIYLVGHSWGAFACLASLKYHLDVQKIVAISPFISIPKTLKKFIPLKYKWLYPFVYIIDILKCKQYSLVNIIKYINKYQGKIKVIASIDDSIINFNTNTKYLLNKCPKIDSLILKNKDHNPQYKLEAINKLKMFRENMNVLKGKDLDEYLKKTNFHELGELDNVVMDEIIKFLDI